MVEAVIRTIHTNDWHFASKNPVSRTDDYNAELFGFLDQLALLTAKFRPQALCVAGDIFHDKSRAPWTVVGRLLEWAQQIRAVCPILIIPGNHDLKDDRYASRAETPIGVLISSGLFLDVSLHAYPMGFPVGVYGPTVIGIPWPDGDALIAKGTIPDTVDIVMVHGFVDQEGNPKWGNFCHRYEDLAQAHPFVKVWHFGHDHQDRGVYTCKNGAKVISVGATARGALDTDTLTRRVKCAIATIDGYKTDVLQVELRQAPVDQIFDLELRAQKVQDQHALETFVTQLREGMVGAVDYREAFDHLPLEKSVRDKVRTYIDRAEQIV